VICKYCNSSNIVKYGTCKGKQLYFCKDCRHKFTELATLPKMQTPMNQVASALSMYYGGMPLDSIQRHIKQEYKNDVAESTIYYWVERFTNEAVSKLKSFKPKVGNTWICDETVLSAGGRNIWFWDVIDTDSRYLLATRVSEGRTTEDAYAVLKLAMKAAGKPPKVILTDKLGSYIDGVKLAYAGETKHIRSTPFTSEDSTSKIERFHGTLKDRINVFRGFKNLETTKLLTDGWLIHYNFFKEHSALGNVPPAQKMGIAVPFKDWEDVVRNSGASVSVSSKIPQQAFIPVEQLTPRQLHSQQIREAKRRYYYRKKGLSKEEMPSVTRARTLRRTKK
jgi:putative transposase